MQSQSPGAFLLSFALHVLVVALIFLFAHGLRRHAEPPPKVFELVAGPGDNYAATEAPAAQPVDSIDFNPLPPLPKLTPPAPPPEPEPEPVPVPATPPPVLRTDPEPVLRPAPPPSKPEPEPKPKAPSPVTQSFADFQKQHGTPKAREPKPRRPIQVREINIKGIVGAISSTEMEGAGGRALAVRERDRLNAYIALLLQRLRAAHENPPGLSDLIHVTLRFHVSANGALSDIVVARSSGNAAFDQSVLVAFHEVRSIGSTPDGKPHEWSVVFRTSDD